MNDTVKFIFKTLTKVPIIIFTCFFIFNIFAFFFIYFRMLGISYVVMQTAVENNFIPQTEFDTIEDYLSNVANITNVDSAGIVVGMSGDSILYVPANNRGNIFLVDANGTETHHNTFTFGDVATATAKHQYGVNVTCGVYCNYTIIWPLDYRYTGDRDAITDRTNPGNDGNYTYNNVPGYDGVAETGNASYLSAFARLPIKIVYTVPGLKYYPDLTF